MSMMEKNWISCFLIPYFRVLPTGERAEMGGGGLVITSGE